MSETSIGSRLASHLTKINKSDLDATDFAVSFFIVDISHYAPCLEGFLIDEYKPILNRESIGFSFGNAIKDTNLWFKYHITEDQNIINAIDSMLQSENY